MRKILKFVKDTINFSIFLLKTCRNYFSTKSIKKIYNGGTVAVLANGPSLKETLKHIQTDSEFKNIDFIVMNYFAFDDIFIKIKPKYYCLADYMFFENSYRKDEAMRLFSILQEKVNWNLNLYIPSFFKLNDFKSFSKLTNKYIHIIPLNATDYKGYECFRFKFYEMNLSMPGIYTVANMAIYIGINLGYSLIRLYGVEHSFLNSLTVDDNNRLCNIINHFNDSSNEQYELKPIIKMYSYSETCKISDYLIGISNMFKSHDLLAEYAKYKHTKILNCTKGSLIDSYERVKF